MNELVDAIWQEKYRPRKVNDVISPFTNEISQSMKNPKAIQNYIFYSRVGGTGKTTMGEAIVEELQCDVLNLNASDARSIDNIRSTVKDYISTMSSNPNCKKCVIMDEGEQLTNDAQKALKGMVEDYSSNCFFIITTNHLKKIDSALTTRFAVYEFINPDKKQIKQYLQNICNSENLKFDDDGLDKLINIHYPSIRIMVNELQKLYNRKLDVTVQNVKRHDEIYKQLWDDITLSKYNEVKTYILKNNINCEELNSYLFYYIVEQNNTKIEIKLIPVFARNERDFKLGADSTLVFISSLPEIIKHIRSENV